MFSQIKVYLLAAAGFMAAIFFGLWQKSKADRVEDQLDATEQARKVEGDAVDALVDGLEKEQKTRNEKIDPDQPRDHFH